MCNKLIMLSLGLALLIMAAIVIVIQKPNNEGKSFSEEIEMEIATIPEKMDSNPEEMISYQQGEIAIPSEDLSTPQEMVSGTNEESLEPVVVVSSVEAVITEKND